MKKLVMIFSLLSFVSTSNAAAPESVTKRFFIRLVSSLGWRKGSCVSRVCISRAGGIQVIWEGEGNGSFIFLSRELTLQPHRREKFVNFCNQTLTNTTCDSLEQFLVEEGYSTLPGKEAAAEGLEDVWRGFAREDLVE